MCLCHGCRTALDKGVNAAAFTGEVVCSTVSLSWLVGLSTGLHKNYKTDFLANWRKDEPKPRIDPILINLWCENEHDVTSFVMD